MDDNNDTPMVSIPPPEPCLCGGGDPYPALRLHARTTMLDDLVPPVGRRMGTSYDGPPGPWRGDDGG